MTARGQRLEYWGALRAFFRPAFLRSVTRASLVRKPARLSVGRLSGSTALSAERHEWLADQLLVHLVREIHVEGPVVDLPLARSGLNPDPGDGLLAAARAERGTGHDRLAHGCLGLRAIAGRRRVLRHGLLGGLGPGF